MMASSTESGISFQNANEYYNKQGEQVMRMKRIAIVLISILVLLLAGCSNTKALESARAAVDALIAVDE